MSTDSAHSPTDTSGRATAPEEKPAWAAAGLFAAGFFSAVNWGGTSGWWYALWIPLLVIALLGAGHEWTVLVKARFRMGVSEWPAMIGTHTALIAGVFIVLGVLRP
ncbi:hypothetical protein ACFWZ2_13025 [Streptomyces sp. NPDC059002]|uniref:hypothetical protein n=1 Tax=Streptomyces sp. NPDC059002 TaxID=3346690 RepID=UPI0036AC7E99